MKRFLLSLAASLAMAFSAHAGEVSVAVAAGWGMALGAGALAAPASGVGRVFWGSVTGQIVERHPGPDPHRQGLRQRNIAVM